MFWLASRTVVSILSFLNSLISISCQSQIPSEKHFICCNRELVFNASWPGQKQADCIASDGGLYFGIYETECAGQPCSYNIAALTRAFVSA